MATRSVTYSGDASQMVQVVGLAVLSGSDDAKVATDVTTAAGLPVAGGAAHDAPFVGPGVPYVGYASAAAPTNVSADGDAVNAWHLRSGAQAVQPTYAGILAVADNGASGTGVQRVTIANDSTGILAAVTTLTGGGIAHDGVDSGNPHKIGARAIAHGTNPTAVAAADRTDLYASRAGILFTIGGHPNTATFSARIPAASGAQTDLAIGPGTVAAGLKVVVTRLTVTCSNANTVNVAVKLGFGASTLVADSTTAGIGTLVDHEGVPPGGGFTVGDGSGILGIGGDGEELRFTCDSPTSGHVIVSGSYYTVES